MIVVFFLYFGFLMGFAPYRQILRSEGFYHLSLLEVILGLLVGGFCLKYVKARSLGDTSRFLAVSGLNRPFFALLVAYAFATGLGFARQSPSNWNNVLRMATVGFEYAMFFILMREIRDVQGLRKFLQLLVLFSVVAVGFVVAFQVRPELLPVTSEMGVAPREYFAGLRRVFTPGSGLILAVALVLLSGLLGGDKSMPRQLRPPALLTLMLLLLALVPSFVRSTFIIVAFWLLVLVLRRLWSSRHRLGTMIALGTFLAAVYGGGSIIRTPSGTTLFDAVVVRTLSVRSLGQEGQLNTLATRLLELSVAAQEIHSTTDHLVGLGLGHMFTYSFPPEEYEASVTHNGYFSLYYSHGILGTVIWLYFLVAVSRRILANQEALKGTALRDFHFGVLMVWFSFLIANVQSPVLQSAETALLLVLSAVISEKAREFAPTEGD